MMKLKQPKILVIDDRLPNLRLLEALLAAEGLQMLAAPSGEDGLRIATDQQPDLILLDILMPGMSGYETCQRLRMNPQTAMLPIVMITSSGDQDKVQAIEGVPTTSSRVRSTATNCWRAFDRCSESRTVTTRSRRSRRSWRSGIEPWNDALRSSSPNSSG